MQTLLQDLQYALRQMSRSFGITVLALLALTIGIGANSTIFSVVYGVLLRPFSYPQSEKLVVILEHQPNLDASVAYPDYMDLRDRPQSFDSLTAAMRSSYNLTGSGEAERVLARQISATFFSTFRVPVAIGRDFNKEDDQQYAAPTTILSHSFWQHQFGGSRDIIGKSITLNGKPFTVIGIAPASFKYGDGIQLYTPLSLGRAPNADRGAHGGLFMIGRLKQGVTLQQAREEMNRLYHQVDIEHPNDGMPGRLATVEPLLNLFVGDIQRPLWIMFAAVGFMLLIACSNVATLLLARASARQREMAVRNALGASRGRIFRQLLTESVLLSVIGGGLGILVAVAGITLLRAAKPSSLPRIEDISLHPWVLAFTAGVSVLCGILFGLLPAVHASKTTMNDMLKSSMRGGSQRMGISRSALVATEFALALVLLVGAGLTIKSFVRLLSVDLGFDPHNLLTFQLSLSPTNYHGLDALPTLDHLAEEIRSIPGVQHVVYTWGAPLVNSVSQSFWRYQDNLRDLSAMQNAAMIMTTPEYLPTMGIKLLRGRFLNDQDRAGGLKVAVVDEQLAKGVFGDKDPIGQRIKYGNEAKPLVMEIVGVVAHVKQGELDEANPLVRMQFYIPLQQAPDEYLPDALRSLTIIVRSSAEPSAISSAVRGKMAKIDPTTPLYGIQTYREVVDSQTEVQRFTMSLLTAFACIALFLATIGIYGVLSYTVQQRTREIGIRMALGARAPRVRAMIVTHAAKVVAIGLGAGLVSALVLTRYMRSILFGVSNWDPVIFVGIAALLATVALIASYLPARRATRVDPLVALHYE
jgi:predicted permease